MNRPSQAYLDALRSGYNPADEELPDEEPQPHPLLNFGVSQEPNASMPPPPEPVSSQVDPMAPSPVMGPPRGLPLGAGGDWAASMDAARREDMDKLNESIDRSNGPVLNRQRNEERARLVDVAEGQYFDQYIPRENISAKPTRSLTPLEREKIAEGIAKGLDPRKAAQYAAGKIPDEDVPKKAGAAFDLPFTEGTPTPATKLGEGDAREGAKFKGGEEPKAKAGGGGAGGGGGSSSMSMRGTVGGGPPPGVNWDDPYFTAAGAFSAKGIAQAQLAEAEGQAAKQRGLADEKAMADQARIQKQYEDLSAAHTQRLELLNREVEEGKVNPDHWWSSKTTGQQIGFGIAAAIGGFAAGFRGTGRNEVLEMMQHEIDRDIKAQEHNLAQKGKAAEGERGILAEAYHRTHNLQEAVQLAKGAAYDHVANQLAEQGAKAKETMGYADVNLATAEWDLKRKELQEKTSEFQQQMAMKQYAIMSRHTGGGGAASLDKRFQKYAAILARDKVPQVRQAVDSYRAAIKSGDTAGVGRITSFFEGMPLTKWAADIAIGEKGRETREAGELAAGDIAGTFGRTSPTTIGLLHALKNGSPQEVEAALRYFDRKGGALQTNAAAQAGLTPQEAAMYDAVHAPAGAGGEAAPEEDPKHFAPAGGGEEE